MLRNADGTTLLQKTEIIDVAKAFSVNLSSLLSEIDFDIKNIYLYKFKSEIFLTTKGLHSLKDKLFFYKIWISIWKIKNWEFKKK